MNKRAILIIDSLRTGGAQQVLLLTARQLCANGWTVNVICMHNDKGTAIWEGLNELPDMKISSLSSGFFDPRAVLKMAEIIRAFKPDLVETHLLRGNTAGLLSAKLAGVPTIAVMHAGAFGKEIRHRSYNVTETFVVKHYADRIVVVGGLVKDFQQKRFPKRKLDVIENSVPVPPEGLTPEKRAVARSLLDIDDDTPLVLAVGRMSVQKAYPDLLAAFAKVRESVKTAKLIIFGGGTLLNEIQNQVNNLGLEEAVRLPGAVVDPPQYLAAGDVYVLSSHSEGLPMAMLEAMAAGLPVVATAVGEVPAILTEDCAVMVKAGDIDGLACGITAYLQDKELGSRAGQAGYKIVSERYSIEGWTGKLLRLIDDLLSDRGKA